MASTLTAEPLGDVFGDLADATPAASTGPADRPPKRGPGRPKGSTAKPATDRDGRAKRSHQAKPKAALAPRLESLLAALGVGVSVVNEADGAAILAGAEQLAKSLDRLASENPAVRRVLESLLVTSAWGEVAIASAAIVLPILANHGVMGSALGSLLGSPAPASPTAAGWPAPGDPFTATVLGDAAP